MKLSKFATALGLALGLGWAAAPASAYYHYSFEDNDIDFVLDASGNVVTSGPLQVGYTLVSVFEIDAFEIDSVNAIPSGQELVGIAAVSLTSIITAPPIPGGGVGTVYNFGAPAIPLHALPGYTGPVLGAGAAIAMFFNGTSGGGGDIDLDVNRTTNPASNCTSINHCVQQASLGTLFQVDGFLGDPDEFWFAVQTIPAGGPISIGQALVTANTLIFASFNAGLSNLYQLGGTVHYINISSGLYCGNPGRVADGCVQVSLSGNLTGGQGLTNGAVAHSDLDGQKYVVAAVPEPATLGLLGLGLLGLGLLRRRQG